MVLNCKKYKRVSNVEVQPDYETSRKDLYVPPKNQRAQSSSSNYANFKRKYADLENTIDNLGTLDLVYFFRETAEENGYRYYISNIKKDTAIMKRLKSNFSNREICGMITFLYESEQDYLDKRRLTPNVLNSNWVNTILPDYELWLDDKYVPVSKQSGKVNTSHEWSTEKKEKSSIGEW